MTIARLAGSTVCAGGDERLAALVAARMTATGAMLAESDMDIFFHAAVVQPAGPFADAIAAGLFAPIRRVRTALAGMRARRRGVVIVCAPPQPLDGDRPRTAAVIGGLATLIRSIAYQYGPDGVRANLLLPAPDAAPNAIADAALLLASPDAGFTTGIFLPIGQPVARWPG